MPSLFSRRRGSSQPPVDRDTQAAAAAAAGTAFLNTTAAQQAALSSAAAAAALRSHATSPEPVGSIQTKRMVRRGSTSSANSSVYAGPGGRAAMQRRASNASMTERTFRSPSPKGRPGLSGATGPSPPPPPVPALPVGAPRSSSVEAVQRVMSPTPPGGKSGRGASLDRASLPPPANQRLSQRMSGLTEAGEEDGGRVAPNFSRPSPQAAPVLANGAKRYTHGTGGFFAGPTGTKDARNARPHTSDGVRAGQAESDDPVMVYDPNSRTFVAQPRQQRQADADPPSPVAAAPVYDPNTRSLIVPTPEPLRTTSSDSAGKKKKPVLAPVQTQLQPPPRNPARLSPTASASPTSPRLGGQLHKQPSMVREDPEAEEREASPAAPTVGTAPRRIMTSAGPAKAYVAPTAPSHHRPASLDIPRGVSSARGRNVSASPARSAHFAAAPIVAGTIHEPLARAASPVKSALKHPGHSPASSVRTSSPMAAFSPTGPKAPPSEVSDITSEASDDGRLRSETQKHAATKKKKKMARVSFDEQPKAIDASGAVAAPKAITANETSTAAGGKRTGAGPAVDSDDELDAELSKPRPALPSFGSVRRHRASSPPEKVTEMAPERDGVSHDAAIGGVLASAKRNEPLAPEVTSKDPASDESDEESSCHPDATSTPGGAEPVQPRSVSVDELDPKTRDFAAYTAERLGSDGDLPAINLLPPTPGDETEKELVAKTAVADGEARESSETAQGSRNSMETYDVPGGWAREDESSSGGVSRDTAAAAAAAAAAPSHVGQPPALAVGDSQVVDSSPSPILDPLTEESEDGEFSDAAEDLSDLDEGGFASLDAIVTSPVAPAPASPSTVEPKAAPESPTAAVAARAAREREKGTESTQTSGDWSEATAYWSKLSRQQKEQIEREHLSDDDTPTPKAQPPRKSALRTTKKKAEDEEPTPRQRERGPRTMPKTMRAQAGPAPAPAPEKAEAGRAGGAEDGKVHMRRSMRGAANAGSTTSVPARMRERPQSSYTAPRPTEQAPTRPRSSAGPATRPATAGRTRTNSDDSTTMPVAQTSPFPRLGSTVPPPGTYTKKIQNRISAAAATKAGNGDSDSESSFRKRQRRRAGSQSTVDSSGRYTMRRSMRGASVSTEATSEGPRPSSPTPAGGGAGGGKKAFSIRSLSPSGGGVFGRSKGEKLRNSLRSGSVDAAASGSRLTTLRSGPAAPAPTMRAGKPPGGPAGGKGFRSRFANDSDDEDEPRGRGTRPFFKSRFADSDDDEPADGAASPPLRAVRGIPRKAGRDDGDSTDLEEEEEDVAAAGAEDVDPRGQDPSRDSRKRGKATKPGVPAAADVDKAMEAARKKLGIPAAGLTGTEGTALSKGSLRQPEDGPAAAEGTPEKKKKRGFMGSILRRNRGSQANVPTASQPPPAHDQAGSPATATAPAPPSSPPPSQVGKLLRRSSAQSPPQMVRGNSDYSTISTATAPVGSTSLRRKPSSDIPPVPALPRAHAAAAARPATSDGPSPEAVRLARRLRPDLIAEPRDEEAARRASVGRSVGFAPGSKEEDGGSELGGGGGVGSGGAVYSRRTGRKKRFAGLRRVFGLYD